MNTNIATATIGVLFGTLAACAHDTGLGSKESVVADADVGRLPAGTAKAVDDARREQASAEDAVSRARLRENEARNELQVAKAEIDSAKAERREADAIQLSADQSQAPKAIELSRKRQDAARAHERAAEARLDYAQKGVDAANNDVATAEQRVKVAKAGVELSKLRALQQAKNPAARKYDRGRFETSVYDERVSLERMQKQSKPLDEQLSLSRKAWEAAQRDWDQKRRAATGG